MQYDKSTQTYDEEIIVSDTDSNDESTVSDTAEPFYDRITESEHTDIVETIYELIDEYMDGFILKMSKPEFHAEIADDICHIVYQDLSDTCSDLDVEYEDLHSFVTHYCDLWFKSKEDITCPLRHEDHCMTNAHVSEFGLQEEFVKTMIAERIAAIRTKDAEGPKQRTKEWYERRYQMMTASNIWQTLASDAQKNRFIYDKCKPLELNIVESKWINTEGSLHWGVKYEPLTVMVYEKLTGARVELFGCIIHDEHRFLGASPDGVVTNAESPLYGRLVEIKNIYNREMDGVPSDAYWIQIQAQLACCNMDFCDFIETRFKEYESVTHFMTDEDDHMKGVILHMVPRDGKSNLPLYQYMPLDITDYVGWIEDTKYRFGEMHVVYKTIYWYLDDVQMTTITRNQRWFEAAVPVFQDIWVTIQRERVTGYEHRAPKKRAAAEVLVIDGTDTVPPTGPKVPPTTCVIKLPSSDLE